MPIKVSATSGTKSEPVPAGSHQAICYGVVAVGTQPSQEYTPRKKVILFWELPHEKGTFNGKEESRAISKTYTLSFNERASLRRDLENWRGRPFTPAELAGFDIDKLIGANCLLSVVHVTKADKTFANVSAVMPLTKGMPKLAGELKPLYFNLDEAMDKAMVNGTVVEFPDDLPEWVVNRCKQSEEYLALSGGKANPPPSPEVEKAPEDESVPF